MCVCAWGCVMLSLAELWCVLRALVNGVGWAGLGFGGNMPRFVLGKNKHYNDKGYTK